MKQIVLIIFASVFCLTAFSQNQYFREFGTEKVNVINFLNNKKSIEINLVEESLVVASSDKLFFSYYFYQGKLIKVSMLSKMPDKKTTIEAHNQFQDFFKLLNASIETVNGKKGEKKVKAEALRAEYELSHYKANEGRYRLKCVATAKLDRPVMIAASTQSPQELNLYSSFLRRD